MGANAQTTVPTFTAGQILTADQQNQSARTGVPVFATTVTRDAAFGGTGEKTLAEGQMCYVEGTGFQTYNGTAWVTWGTTPATGGLELISSTTIGNAVSSVAISNVFSSTYDNYRVIISGGAGSTNNYLNMQMGATTTGYYAWGVSGTYNSNTVTGDGESNVANFRYVAAYSTNSIWGVVDLSGPNLAKNTHYNAAISLSNTIDAALWYNGYLADTTQYTGFTLLAISGTITGGTVKVYGYKN